MKKPGASLGRPASELIPNRVAELGAGAAIARKSGGFAG